MSKTDRQIRQEARAEILDAANRHQRKIVGHLPHPYRMRHIQRAVCIVRRACLVKPAVLADAGFRP